MGISMNWRIAGREKMKTIIAGSRHIDDYNLVSQAIEDSGFEITEVVSGGCRGVDKLGEKWALGHGIPIEHFQADWQNFGRAAGPVRNRGMAQYADALIALLTKDSKGTKDMIKQAHIYGLKIFIVNCDG